MMRSVRNVALSVSAMALLVASPAAATTNAVNPDIANGETVVAELSPSGSVETARLLSQLAVVGDGRVVLLDPVSGKGMRNLDGFSAPVVRNGKAQYTIDVNGVARRRTISDFDKELPLTVKAEYLLDGQRRQAKDIVGKSGRLEVRYTVANVSGTPTDVTWKDGMGASHTKTVDLVTPMVGSLDLDLPASFTKVRSERADLAANGHGGTAMSFTMVLFPPIGESIHTLTYTAQVKDAVMPSAKLSAVPVVPTVKPQLKGGADSYRDGAAAAALLTEGAGKIDDNLLKLQDGAGDLLAGLLKLGAGAVQLRDGLSGQLAPGADKLASGATAAQAGSAKLKAGVDKLAAGADQVSGGLGAASAGSGELADGLVSADGGAQALAEGIALILQGVENLPATLAADPDYQRLVGALSLVKAGIGTPTDTSATTVLGGMNLLRYGLRSPLGVSGCDRTATPGTATACGAADAVQLVQTQLAAAAASGGTLDQLIGAAKAGYVAAGCPDVPSGVVVPVTGVLPPATPGLSATCVYLSSLAYGLALPAGVDSANPLGGVKAQTALASGTLQAVYQGIDARVLPGIGRLKLALSNPACSLADPQNTSNPCGIYQVQTIIAAGIATLVTQISAELSGFLSDAADGAASLAEGTALLSAGGADLADGLSQLDAGGALLADGSRAAAEGAGALDGGLTKIKTGAGQLSDGIDEAASGAGLIVGGLDKVTAGTQKLEAGAAELRAKGTGLLVEGGNDVASENAEKYATLVALSIKTKDGALPYGAPEGATGAAAYSLTLAGASTEARDNATRGLVAVGLLALALVGSSIVRRRLAK